jgi:S-adenosylmethionine decarboxylase
MTHLDPEACRAFYYPAELLVAGEGDQEGHAAGLQLSRKLGVDTLLQDATLDSFLFTPCGYSANIVKEDRYATIHVTPEADWSYASFECNVDFRAPVEPDQPHGNTIYDSEALHNLIGKVLNIFKPQRLSITLFVSVEESAAGVDQGNTPETKTILDPKVAEGYRRTDRILYEFAGYHLLFSTFEKRST